MEKLTGYVLDVSPVKNARNGRTKYFTAKFQHSKDEINRLVCFSPEKHAVLKNAENSDDPVTLVDAIMTPSSDGKTEIKLTRHTSVQTSSKKLNFSKSYQAQIETPVDIRKPKTITELKNEHDTGDVNVKLIKYVEERQVHTKYGPTKIIIAIVSDRTDSRKLVLWNSDLKPQLEENNFYNITNVQNRLFDSRPQLNTTSSTRIIKIPPFEGYKEQLQETDKITCKAIMISANATELLICSVCKKPIKSTSITKGQRITKCPQCNYKQITNDMIKTLSIHVILNYDDGETQKCTIQHEVIKTYLASIEKSNLIDDTDALEDYLILQKEFTISKNKNGDQLSKLQNFGNSNQIDTY